MPDRTTSKRILRNQTGSSDRDRLAIAVYVGAVAALAGLFAIQTWNHAFGSDVYAHLAVLRELAARPFDPLNPYVASTDPAHYFSPYSVGLGLIGRVTGASPITLLYMGAAVNFGLLATGLWLFPRSLSTYRWTPHLALFFTLLAWGIGGFRWSGFLGLNSIGFGLGYPSTFATGVSLIALAGLCRYLTSRNRTLLLLLGIAAAVITLTHLFTAFWTAIAALAIVASQPMFVLRRLIVGLLGASVVAALLVLMWPYSSMLSLMSGASARSDAHEVLYGDLWLNTFLLIPGFVAIGFRARRNLRDPLVLMSVACLVVLVFGYAAHSYGLGRVIPLIALSSHVALADLTAGLLIGKETRRSGIAVVAVVGVVGLTGSIGGWTQMIPRGLAPESTVSRDLHLRSVTPYQPIESILAPTDIVFASPWMNRVVPSVAGRVVVPGHLTPLLSDRTEREQASAAFFDNGRSTDERNAIAFQWGVTYIVVEPEDVSSFPWLVGDYRLAAESNEYVIFAISPLRID